VGDQGAAHVVSVDVGEVTVEHDHVVAGEGGVVEGVSAVEDHVDRHALAAQHGGDSHRQLGVVLDHQDSHL
jgi:hypothetical protein